MFTRRRLCWRWALLLTAAVAAVGAVWLLGCSGESIGEALGAVGHGGGSGGGGGGGGGGDGGNTTPSHTHTWGNWVVTTPATCDAKGVETRTCTQNASHKETREIAKLSGAACVVAVDPNTVVKGTFTDSRDGQTYKTVKIGSQTWMAENLNYETGNSWCYDGNNSNCNQYGRLYDWNTAKTACPRGWHLPSRQEWNTLVDNTGGYDDAGKKLKSKSGWNGSGNGTDAYGFSALPGGYRDSDGDFDRAGNRGYWWTATEYDSNNASSWNMFYDLDNVYEGNIGGKKYGLSVRCVQD